MDLFKKFRNTLEGDVLDFSGLRKLQEQGVCNNWNDLKNNVFKNPNSRIDFTLQNFLDENYLLKHLKDNSILTPVGWEYGNNTIILKMNDQFFPLNDEEARYKITEPLLIGSSSLILNDKVREYSFKVLN